MNDVFDFIQKNGSFNQYKNGYILFCMTHDLCSFMTLKFSPEKDLFFTSENDKSKMMVLNNSSFRLELLEHEWDAKCIDHCPLSHTVFFRCKKPNVKISFKMVLKKI